MPSLAVRALKQHYLAAAGTDFPTFVDLELQRHYHLLATADAREGFAAFSQRRAPVFTGR
jgi:enoyl-CoA hydratase/carnithine racemase